MHTIYGSYITKQLLYIDENMHKSSDLLRKENI